MTAKITKGLYSFVMVFYFIFLSLLGAGDYLYPDKAGLFTGQELESRLCFSCREEETGTGKVLAFGILPVKSVSVEYYEDHPVLCGGQLFGLRLETGGLLITGMAPIPVGEGERYPGKDAGLQTGDLLLRADGVELKSAAAFQKILAKNEGNRMRLDLERAGEAKTCFLTPAKDRESDAYRAGLWVRDGAAGIGTVTFIQPETGVFAGLGHAVCDRETGLPFPLGSGTVCRAEIETLEKGTADAPGQIHGRLAPERMGLLLENAPCGVYGKLDRPDEFQSETVPIALRDSVKTGKATLVCSVSGQKEEYDVEIEEIIAKDRESKNFVLHVTSPKLLSLCGGIVQGMSGSPILQDGKLIGAVTHVLVGDPTRGYGIFIENMLETANQVAEEQAKKEAS